MARFRRKSQFKSFVLGAAGAVLLSGIAIVSGSPDADANGASPPTPTLEVLEGGVAATAASVGDALTLRTTTPVSASGVQSVEMTARWSSTTSAITGASDVTAPSGWTKTFTTDGTNYVASGAVGSWSNVIGVKTVGTVTSSGFTAPSPSYPLGLQNVSTSALGTVRPTLGNFQGGAAGDGWNAFHGDGKIFNIYHHANPFGIDCHIRVSNGSKCWPSLGGAAFTVSGFITGAHSAGFADEARDRVWGVVRRIQAGDQTGNYGFLCIDYQPASPQVCQNVGTGGFVSLGTTNLLTADVGINGIGELIEYDGRLYTKSNDADSPVLCLELSTAAACDVSPIYGVSQSAYSSPEGAWNINKAKRFGNRLYITSNQRFFDCLDLDSHSRCTGGSWPVTTSAATFVGPLFAVTTNQGQTIEKICTHSGVGGTCYTTNGVATSNVPNLPGTSGSAWDGWGDNFNHLALDRYYYTTSRVSWGCYDFATNAICTKPNPPGGQWSQSFSQLDYVYALTVDPIDPYCLWSNADNGTNKIRPFNALTGEAGCAPVNPTTDITADSLLTRLPCSASGAVRGWTSLRVIPGSNLLSAANARLTVLKDGQINQVVAGWSSVAPTAEGVWDLSSLTLAASGTSPTFAISWSVGELAGTSANLQYLSDPAQLCVNLAVNSPCPSGNGQSATVGLPGVDHVVLATSKIGSAAAVDLHATTVATENTTCLGTVTGTLTEGGQPLANAVVTLMPASVVPIQVTTSAQGTYSIPRLYPSTYPLVFGLVNGKGPNPIPGTVVIPKNQTVTVSASYDANALRAPDITRTVTINNGAVFTVSTSAGAGVFDPTLTRLVNPSTGVTVSALSVAGQPNWSLDSNGNPQASAMSSVGTHYAIYQAETSGGSTAQGLLTLIVTNPAPSTTAPSSGSGFVIPPTSAAPSSAVPTTQTPATTTPPTTRAPAPPVTVTLAPGAPGSLPQVPAGQSLVIENGAPVQATVQKIAESTWQMTGRGFQWQMQIPALGEQPGSDRGVVTLVTDRDVEISGFGFKGESLVDLWLFSTPVYIGTVRVDANGNFVDELKVPSNITPGFHTLQANGLTPDDVVRTLNLGVQVLRPKPRLPVTGSSSFSVLEIAVWLVVGGTAVCAIRRRRYRL